MSLEFFNAKFSHMFIVITYRAHMLLRAGCN